MSILCSIKGMVQAWLYRLAVHARPSLGIYIANRCLPWGRPNLEYVELHLADHCNLNCAGCFHYAPFAAPRLANPETVKRDFARLKELFGNIRHVQLMGGEPLLNPKVVEIAAIVKEAYPKSRVTVVTNGLLLKSFRGLSALA